ncbi:uncharacterized protein BCR38DRAFT_89148 [Pseudomassariella vexata]|uniref:Uncharacterized protein n=1 Tax=Pseudomassariella vexata TaxID=1141098 RepID=A0A1Y2EDX8_9PEZI|nr:uncharacterized protein BCR38DRAFT_89148 [Pseudomassariella vexata]ORY69617.1 hypothetical protein BCR38DRAFT_89148 [Pseudomassariella vexata]
MVFQSSYCASRGFFYLFTISALLLFSLFVEQRCTRSRICSHPQTLLRTRLVMGFRKRNIASRYGSWCLVLFAPATKSGTHEALLRNPQLQPESKESAPCVVPQALDTVPDLRFGFKFRSTVAVVPPRWHEAGPGRYRFL